MNELFYFDSGFGKPLFALSIVVSAVILGFILRKALLAFANKKYKQKKATALFIISLAKSIILLLIALAFLVGAGFFDFTNRIEIIITTSAKVLFAIALGVWAYHLVEISNVWFINQSGKSDNTGQMLYSIFKKAFQVIIIAIVIAQVFQIISNKPLTPILASFGIVGAAVALASQDTFKNFFGSFVIASDKPFKIGERVVIDGHDGIVDSIGIRSTRIRTLNDHLVTIPNGALANKTIQNIGKRDCIKREFTLNLTYSTSPEKIEQAIEIVKRILSNHEGMKAEYQPRVYFNNLNTYSLDILVIYWYFPPNFWDYMDFSQKVNMQIISEFNKAKIEFAFPTQTIELLNN